LSLLDGEGLEAPPRSIGPVPGKQKEGTTASVILSSSISLSFLRFLVLPAVSEGWTRKQKQNKTKQNPQKTKNIAGSLRILHIMST
jgi:hypothetical protein